VDFNLVDEIGNTPLNFAVQVGNYDFVKMLIIQGADYNKPNVRILNLEIRKHTSSLRKLLWIYMNL